MHQDVQPAPLARDALEHGLELPRLLDVQRHQQGRVGVYPLRLRRMQLQRPRFGQQDQWNVGQPRVTPDGERDRERREIACLANSRWIKQHCHSLH